MRVPKCVRWTLLVPGVLTAGLVAGVVTLALFFYARAVSNGYRTNQSR